MQNRFMLLPLWNHAYQIKKQLYQFFLGRNKKKTVPDFPPDTLSSTFNYYFHHKPTNTLSNLPPYTSLITPTLPSHSRNVFTVSSI